jgi:hypothetical protein
MLVTGDVSELVPGDFDTERVIELINNQFPNSEKNGLRIVLLSMLLDKAVEHRHCKQNVLEDYVDSDEGGLHATISDRKLRRPPGRKLLAYRIDREPLPPCKVRVKGQPLRGGLTRQAGWHGGHSQSIPAAISCKHQHTTGGRPCLIYAGSMTRISRKML